jgi:hypothetical protein
MNKRARRTRIVQLVSIAGLLIFVNAFAGSWLEDQLGWTFGGMLFSILSGASLLVAMWHLLGFFIDKDVE